MLVERGMKKDKRGGDHQDATRTTGRAVWMANYQRGPEESAGEKKKKWKIENFEVGNLQYGIYFKFGSLPNYYDDDWLDWGLFLFFLVLLPFKNVHTR